jgi:hypothetical protein
MNNNYYIFDNCYKQPPTLPDVSFQIKLREDYYKTTVSSVKECEIQSLRNNSEFFLINDVNTTLNNININCYIPKLDSRNQSLYGDNSVITKSINIFNSIFKKDGFFFTQPGGVVDTCNTLMFNKNETLANQKCFKYLLDNREYAPSNYYAYYKKPMLNEDNISLMSQIDPPVYYKDKIPLLKTYEEMLRIDNNNIEYSGELTKAFKKYICDSQSQTTLTALTTQLTQLQGKYTAYNTYLNEIIYDLSSISHLNSYNDETIKAVNLNIANKSRELSKMLGSGGANNGRLDDTTLLTQFKIVENSILLLLIISIIFYFTKNKKVIQAT